MSWALPVYCVYNTMALHNKLPRSYCQKPSVNKWKKISSLNGLAVMNFPTCTCSRRLPPCIAHRNVIQDKPALPRAVFSVPDGLTIKACEDASERGIFAQVEIPKNTVYGPLVGDLQNDSRMNTQYAIGSQEKGWMMYCLDNDDQCNWMKFVRFDKNSKRRNLIAFQENERIYFYSTKSIWPGEELKVWYSKSYQEDLIEAGIFPTIKEKVISTVNVAPATVKVSTLSSFLMKTVPSTEEPQPKKKRGERFKPAASLVINAAISSVNQDQNITEEEKVNAADISVFDSEAPEIVETPMSKKRKTGDNLVLPKKKRKSEIVRKSPRKKQKPRTINTYTHSCEDCGAAFRANAVLELHKIIHGAAFPVHSTSNCTYFCPGCMFSTISKEALIEHVDFHKKPPPKALPVPCTKCGRGFATDWHLEIHNRRAHPAVPRDPVECQTCHQKFKNKSAYSQHAKVHDKDHVRIFRCPVCLLTFQSSVHLQEHSASHCENGQFSCRLCPNIYSSFQALTTHMRAWHFTKKLSCEVCGNTFVSKDKLKVHMSSHSDTRAFKCDQCGQQFKFLPSLTRHMKNIHNPARPPGPIRKTVCQRSTKDYNSFVYKCVECKLGFLQRKPLVKHMEQRHPGQTLSSVPELMLPVVQVDVFPCYLCRKRYMSNDALQSHLNADHPDGVSQKKVDQTTTINLSRTTTTVLYLCTVCGLRFVSAKKLLEHAQVRHPEYDPACTAIPRS